jgi:hypothetical protein
MSDILNETIVSIHEAAAVFPGRRPGKKLNFRTLWRWIIKGIHAADGQIVRLEAVRLGARWVTSREAIARFSARLTPTTTEITGSAGNMRTPTQRQLDGRVAAKELEKMGIK